MVSSLSPFPPPSSPPSGAISQDLAANAANSALRRVLRRLFGLFGLRCFGDQEHDAACGPCCARHEEFLAYEQEKEKKGGKVAMKIGGVVEPAKQPVAGVSRRVSAGDIAAAGGASSLLKQLDEVERNKKWEAEQAKKAGEIKVKGKGKGKEMDAWKPRSDAK